MARTSLTHPLRLDMIEVGPGRLGLTLCPGKSGASVFGAAWDRDLDIDADAMTAWGASAVVTLIEDHEFDLLRVRPLGEVIRARGIDWLHFPVRDLDVPTPERMDAWRKLSPELHARLEAGQRIVVHCRGGLGRAGTIAALLLIERGAPAPEAIRAVRAARPGAIETEDQARWLHDRARHAGAGSLRLHAALLGAAMGDSGTGEGGTGAISGRTALTLFVVEGMIRARIRGEFRGVVHPPSVVHHALLRWFRAQGGRPSVETDDIGLVTDPRLGLSDGVEPAVLMALSASVRLGVPGADLAPGAGLLPAVGAVGLMAPGSTARDQAAEIARLAGADGDGESATVAWTTLLAEVAAGAPVPTTLHGAGDLPDTSVPLAAALDACTRHAAPDDILAIAGRQGRTARVLAGMLAGARDPAAILSHPRARATPCADLCARLARDHGRLLADPHAAEELFDRYPGT